MTRFCTAKDKEREAKLDAVLEQAWGVKIYCYGDTLDEVDRYICKEDKVVGFAEYKCREYNSTAFETVYLSWRKFIALKRVSEYSGKPSLFVVQFLDCVKWIDVNKVDPKKLGIYRRGRAQRKEDSPNDMEPIIEVPIEKMTMITEPTRDG